MAKFCASELSACGDKAEMEEMLDRVANNTANSIVELQKFLNV